MTMKDADRMVLALVQDSYDTDDVARTDEPVDWSECADGIAIEFKSGEIVTFSRDYIAAVVAKAVR
ncbi:MAG: hypothetical protein V4537_14200 [Pseudomonadota bacterium]